MAGQRVIVTKSKLDALANSVAAKSGVPVLMTIDQMKVAVDSIELPEAEYYIWQDQNGYVRVGSTMPAISSSGTVLKLPGWLMRIGVMERVVNVENTELQLGNSIVTEVTEFNE